MKILLAIDESPSSEEAIREVAERFRTPDTTVRVLHVVAKFVPPAAALWDAGGSVEVAREEVVSRYRGLVEGVAERLTAAGVTAETAIRKGGPGKVIINEAKKWGADLIVLGSHGHTRLVRMPIGKRRAICGGPCLLFSRNRSSRETQSE